MSSNPDGARCVAGKYEGAFAGVGAGLLSDNMISGKLILELTPRMGQDQLNVTGKLEGEWQRSGLITEASVPVIAHISAFLDCATHQLKDGQLYSTDDAGGIFAGWLEGAYSDSPPSLTGTWSGGDELSGVTGTWSALPVKR